MSKVKNGKKYKKIQKLNQRPARPACKPASAEIIQLKDFAEYSEFVKRDFFDRVLKKKNENVDFSRLADSLYKVDLFKDSVTQSYRESFLRDYSLIFNTKDNKINALFSRIEQHLNTGIGGGAGGAGGRRGATGLKSENGEGEEQQIGAREPGKRCEKEIEENRVIVQRIRNVLRYTVYLQNKMNSGNGGDIGGVGGGKLLFSDKMRKIEESCLRYDVEYMLWGVLWQEIINVINLSVKYFADRFIRSGINPKLSRVPGEVQLQDV